MVNIENNRINNDADNGVNNGVDNATESVANNGADDHSTKITEKLSPGELSRHMARQEANHRLQKDLMTFAFTATLVVISAGLGMEIKSVSTSLIFLMPFLIIIPFQARITYYTLDSAHFRSFIQVFQGEEDRYSWACRECVKEKYGLKPRQYSLLALLVNHELALLGLACDAVFGIQLYQLIQIHPRETWKIILPSMAAIIATLTVIWLCNMTYPYTDTFERYEDKWKEYKPADESDGATHTPEEHQQNT